MWSLRTRNPIRAFQSPTNPPHSQTIQHMRFRLNKIPISSLKLPTTSSSQKPSHSKFHLTSLLVQKLSPKKLHLEDSNPGLNDDISFLAWCHLAQDPTPFSNLMLDGNMSDALNDAIHQIHINYDHISIRSSDPSQDTKSLVYF
ncbi:hypothetical protein GYMLUDRAFT_65227 [Collybiopsis luxurians FD-317 M1]|uniref:Uncharacterized protein n=1 Tax=Collybiopsis luxurians FD-317 M1 TaxID=944289 RepID=A0A0D0B8T4_9AGAR|nr:hypothetical protein GYMLUDRAFT_65227 [Collybiopsis luxurians FD-317 M1]